VENNPVNLNDPSGKCAVVCTGVIGGVVGAVSGGLSAYLTDGNVLQGAFVGGVTGAAIGSGLAFLAPAGIATGWGASQGLATAVDLGVSVGTVSTTAFGTSVAAQTADHGFSNVDYQVATNNALIAGAATVFPAAGSAAMATSPVAYSWASQALTTTTLAITEAAIGVPAGVAFQDYTTPSPYMDPNYSPGADSNFDFSALPSTSSNIGLMESVYFGGK
jgi:hypothetical protein